jgi:transcriptional regulator with XRE-family HTH domain
LQARIPALPFCYVTLRQERQKEGYPKQLNSLDDHLQTRRLDLGLLWKDVAERLGTAATNVANWSKGRTAPGLKFWPRIIQFLGYDPRPAPETIGQAIRRHREGQGMTQEELASSLHVDPTTLARWEQGARRPVGDS